MKARHMPYCHVRRLSGLGRLPARGLHTRRPQLGCESLEGRIVLTTPLVLSVGSCR